ncbi:unnamed protein product [Caenorhabditis bovis]|uniref:Uncharacterized protein n=1 Tax=Caenorhabditis bovis TaxID=2654633 RepID=A0A8S1ET42_9PELO|nr:unnamed protein product [Caenorhabditis bovis]
MLPKCPPTQKKTYLYDSANCKLYIEYGSFDANEIYPQCQPKSNIRAPHFLRNTSNYQCAEVINYDYSNYTTAESSFDCEDKLVRNPRYTSKLMDNCELHKQCDESCSINTQQISKNENAESPCKNFIYKNAVQRSKDVAERFSTMYWDQANRAGDGATPVPDNFHNRYFGKVGTHIVNTALARFHKSASTVDMEGRERMRKIREKSRQAFRNGMGFRTVDDEYLYPHSSRQYYFSDVPNFNIFGCES